MVLQTLISTLLPGQLHVRVQISASAKAKENPPCLLFFPPLPYTTTITKQSNPSFPPEFYSRYPLNCSGHAELYAPILI